jgi:hypothetical protein
MAGLPFLKIEDLKKERENRVNLVMSVKNPKYFKHDL